MGNMTAKERECHFTWNLGENAIRNYYTKEIEHLQKEIELDADIKARGLITLAYFYAVQENPQFDESLKCLDDALKICDKLRHNHPEYEGYKTVALRNKTHVLELMEKKADDVEEIIRETENMRPFYSVALAGIHGLKGFTMTLFTDEEHLEEGYKSYQEATELDPENFEWYLGMGILAKKLRKLREGDKTEPSHMEEDHLSKAVQLSDEKKPLPLALLADVHFDRGRVNLAKKQSFHEKAKPLYKKAYELAPLNIHVLKRCGKAFPVMREIDLAEECLLKALQLEPDNTIIMHRLGKLYWRSRPPKQDYEKAENYFVRAIKDKNRNFYSDIDLAVLRKVKNNEYNIRDHLKQCRKYYINQPKCLDLLDYWIEKNEFDETFRHFDSRFWCPLYGLPYVTRQYGQEL